jgi:tetratricopeptide (TPR) repeat protein
VKDKSGAPDPLSHRISEISEPDLESLASGKSSGPENSGGPEDLERKIHAAVELFHGGEYVRCLTILRDLDGTPGEDPRITAFTGACRALVLGDHRQGLDACVTALKKAFYIPDLYCALGVVLLRIGERAKAYAAYQRGLRIDPRHPALQARLLEMGLRRRPVLRFLPRSHHANRFLGRLRARFFPG